MRCWHVPERKGLQMVEATCCCTQREDELCCVAEAENMKSVDI